MTATGEDEISLEEQKFACGLAIGAVRRRVEDADKAGRLTEDLRQDLQAQAMKLNTTLNFILAEIQHQEKVKTEVKEESSSKTKE